MVVFVKYLSGMPNCGQDMHIKGWLGVTTSRIRLSLEEIIEMLGIKKLKPETCIRVAENMFMCMIEAAVNQGLSVIIDGYNLDTEKIESLINDAVSQCRKDGINVSVIGTPVKKVGYNLDEYLILNNKSENPVSEFIIRKLYFKYIKPKNDYAGIGVASELTNAYHKNENRR